jgi:hypothetical protein
MDDSLHFETPIFKLKFQSGNNALGSILDFDLRFCVEHHKIFFSSLFVKITKLMKSILQFELNLDPTIQSSSGFQFPICPISIF